MSPNLDPAAWCLLLSLMWTCCHWCVLLAVVCAVTFRLDSRKTVHPTPFFAVVCSFIHMTLSCSCPSKNHHVVNAVARMQGLPSGGTGLTLEQKKSKLWGSKAAESSLQVPKVFLCVALYALYGFINNTFASISIHSAYPSYPVQDDS